MKIAVVNKFFFPKGGQETLMFEEAKLHEEMGHEVAFFSMHHPQNPSEYKYSKYFTDYAEFASLGQEYTLWQKLKIAENFIYNKQAAQKFEEFINDFRPDIIHCHGIAHQLTPSILKVADKYNIRVIQTLHDYQLICPNYTLLRSGKTVCKDLRCSNGNYINCVLNKCVKNSLSASLLSAFEIYFNYTNNKYLNLVEKFISPSKFLKDTLVRAGLPENKIVHIPNFIGIDSNNDFSTSNQGYSLFAGRLSFEKGTFSLLNAFKDLPDVKLKIAGTGLLEKELFDFKEQHNINNVEFVGFKSGEELQNLLKNCTALIIPSEWYENCPMSIIEAFCYSKPVIGTDLGGIPEMVHHEKTGLLFEPGNTEELKKNIIELTDPEKAALLGKNAKEFASEIYLSKENHYKQLAEVFKFDDRKKNPKNRLRFNNEF